MTAHTILYIILGISIIGYVFDQLLDYINLRAQRKDIPDEIAGFYDREKYLKSLDYQLELTKFGFLTAAFGFTIT